jgi:hypothetical protein
MTNSTTPMPIWSLGSPTCGLPRSGEPLTLADAENRADYLKEVFSNVNAFLDAVVTDTVNHLPGISRMNRDKLDVAVWDMMNVDVVNVARQLHSAGCHLGDIRAAA